MSKGFDYKHKHEVYKVDCGYTLLYFCYICGKTGGFEDNFTIKGYLSCGEWKKRLEELGLITEEEMFKLGMSPYKIASLVNSRLLKEGSRL